jgi:hypothetical protein
MAADQHSLTAAELCAGHNRVAEATDGQVGYSVQCGLDEISDVLLVVGLTRNVDQGSGQCHHIGREVKP